MGTDFKNGGDMESSSKKPTAPKRELELHSPEASPKRRKLVGSRRRLSQEFEIDKTSPGGSSGSDLEIQEEIIQGKPPRIVELKGADGGKVKGKNQEELADDDVLVTPPNRDGLPTPAKFSGSDQTALLKDSANTKNEYVTFPTLSSEVLTQLGTSGKVKYHITKWFVSVGDVVAPDTKLATFEVKRSREELAVYKGAIKCSHHGVLTKIIGSTEKSYLRCETLCVINYCPHDIEYNGLCVVCGKDVTLLRSEKNNKFTVVQGDSQLRHRQLKLSKRALRKVQEETVKSLIAKRKILLVLDIDQTFLQATQSSQARKVLNCGVFKSSTFSFKVSRHSSPYYFKIRPGFKKFLHSCRDLFDVRVYTMSVREYAEKVVNIVDDPIKPIIMGRIVSRDDVVEEKQYKSIERLCPCDESLVLIVDDRVDVWASKRNVIKIHKYQFWPDNVCVLNITCSLVPAKETFMVFREFLKSKLRAFNPTSIVVNKLTVTVKTKKPPGRREVERLKLRIQEMSRDNDMAFLKGAVVSLQVDVSELRRRDGDAVLPMITRVLEKIHKQFYKRYDDLVKKSSSEAVEDASSFIQDHPSLDVRIILDKIQKDVFQGLRFVFSGVYPQNTAFPEKTEIWRTAVKFGATCVKTISHGNPERVTHCIAKRPGTHKVKTAWRAAGCKVVHENWFWNSVTHYMPADLALFQLLKSPNNKGRLTLNGSSGSRRKDLVLRRKRPRPTVLGSKDNTPPVKFMIEEPEVLRPVRRVNDEYILEVCTKEGLKENKDIRGMQKSSKFYGFFKNSVVYTKFGKSRVLKVIEKEDKIVVRFTDWCGKGYLTNITALFTEDALIRLAAESSNVCKKRRKVYKNVGRPPVWTPRARRRPAVSRNKFVLKLERLLADVTPQHEKRKKSSMRKDGDSGSKSAELDLDLKEIEKLFEEQG